MTVMTLPTLNSVLLFDLLRWAEHDEAIDTATWGTWDQSLWGWVKARQDKAEARNGACRTAYCMAGQAAHQAGYRLVYEGAHNVSIDMFDGHHYQGQVLTADDCVPQYDTGRKDAKGYPIWADVPGGEARSISVVGREVLGLTEFEAGEFFEGNNDLHRLRALANRFCMDRNLPLLYPYGEVWDGEYGTDDDDFDW